MLETISLSRGWSTLWLSILAFWGPSSSVFVSEYPMACIPRGSLFIKHHNPDKYQQVMLEIHWNINNELQSHNKTQTFSKNALAPACPLWWLLWLPERSVPNPGRSPQTTRFTQLLFSFGFCKKKTRLYEKYFGANCMVYLDLIVNPMFSSNCPALSFKTGAPSMANCARMRSLVGPVFFVLKGRAKSTGSETVYI